MVIAKSELKEFHPRDAILFRCLTRLRMLSLTSNLNFVSLPSTIICLRNLAKLDLNWCLGLKRLPWEIGQLESFEKLNMAGCCSLTKIPAKVGKSKNLVELNMQSYGIVMLPHEIRELMRLAYLCLNYYNPLEAVPEVIGKSSSLEKLECDMLKISEIPRSLGDLSKLKHLSFAACGTITKIPAEFVKLKSLISICFATCHQLVVVPDELENMVTEGSLKVFDVSNCTRVRLRPDLLFLQERFANNFEDIQSEPEAGDNLKVQYIMQGVLVDPSSVFHPNNKEERRASFGVAQIISIMKTEPFFSQQFDMAIRLMYTMANHDGTKHAIVRSGGLHVLRCIDKGCPKHCGLYVVATLCNICMTHSTHKVVVDSRDLVVLTYVLHRKTSNLRFYAYQTLTLVMNGDIAKGDYLFTSEINEQCG